MADLVLNLTEIFEEICNEYGFTIEEKQKMLDYFNSEKGKAELQERIDEKTYEIIHAKVMWELCDDE